MIARLPYLMDKYSSNYPLEILEQKSFDLYNKSLKSKEESLLDAVSIATGLTIETVIHLKDPLIIDALHKQYPELDLDSLHSMTTEQLNGIVNGVKGKYFEELLVDKLNHGETVAGMTLSDGQHALLADNPLQPGWDIKITDNHGHIVDYLQAKATNSLSYIKEALDKYPDIHVVTTADLADKLDGDLHDHVFYSEIHNDIITDQVSNGVQDLSHSFLQEFLEHFNPLIPLGVIAFQEGSRVLTGKYEVSQAIKNGRKRGIKSLTALGVGSSLAALDFGVISIPASFITRLSFDRIENLGNLSKLINKHTTAVESLAVSSRMLKN